MTTESKFRLEHRRHGEGHLTVAYKYNETDCVIDYAVSACSPEDQFSRWKGRTVATGRLERYIDEATGRNTRLVSRCLAGSIPASTEPDKKEVIDNIVNVVSTMAPSSDRLRWMTADNN